VQNSKRHHVTLTAPLSGMIFTVRCYACMVLAMGLCLSVCLCLSSRSATKTAKRRITKTTPHDSPGTLSFLTPRISAKFDRGHPRRGHQNWRLLTNNRLHLENGTRQTRSFYLSRIKSRMRSIKWWHCP